MSASSPAARARAVESVILSDMHLSEAALPRPDNPLWMAYKRRELFFDEDFARLCRHVAASTDGPLELVLNGDVFDFDNVTRLPAAPAGSIDWLARLRGLASEEWMSLHKMEVIIGDHPVWFAALRDFVGSGHRVVFIIGNHDCEMAWPSVQERLCRELGVEPRSRRASGAPSSVAPPEGPADDDDLLADDSPVVFCPWFYLSGGDTFVSHGHQYDAMCAQKNAIDPVITVGRRPRIRVPFGDLAGRYLLNGMGYFNPHATQNYIMSAGQYLRFFFRYMVRTQPFLFWTWFWGSIATFVIALRDHWRPAMCDPLMVDDKVRSIAARSRATPSMVRKLAALDRPSICNNPLLVLRELWLDRALLFIAVIYAAWQVVLNINIAWSISPLWVVVPLAFLLPPFFVYAYSVKAATFAKPLLTERRAELIAKITGVERIVLGHTHVPDHKRVGSVELLNDGFWSPAFAEPECKTRIGAQTYVQIRASGEAGLWEWERGAKEPTPFVVITPPGGLPDGDRRQKNDAAPDRRRESRPRRLRRPPAAASAGAKAHDRSPSSMRTRSS